MAKPAEECMSHMSVAGGTRFGSYEVLYPIGAGGMGIVYRARDIRLGRSVAIKILPAECSCDPSRLLHFEQEARALSSINHPNIVTLYALGDPADAYYIVMELVEGETLRQRMTGERMKVRAVLDIGTQVAGALSAAHSAGIVHRDIKPENVMIRPDGLVKVLDFGLAKLIEPCTYPQSPAVDYDIFTRDTLAIDDVNAQLASPYVTTPNDMPDAARRMIMGTATYMSPEQLCGQAVDARTDIFSLGVTLYELVAGVTPFGGPTSAEVIDAILEREPAPLVRYRPEVPRDLEHIISKALRKDRECRYQDIKDLLIDLQDVKHEREFEATLKRSAQYNVVDQARAERAVMVSEQHDDELAHLDSTQGSQPILGQTTSLPQITLSEFIGNKIGAAVTPIQPADWVIVLGWKFSSEPPPTNDVD